MPGKFITIHGIDGTGKTTTARALAYALQDRGLEALNYDALEVVEGAARGQEEMRQDAQTQLYRSLGRKCIQGFAVQQALTSGKSVVKDRWTIDVLAANTYLGAAVPAGDLGILVPDMSILLVCGEQVRQQRVRARRHATADDLVPNLPGTRAHYFEGYLMDHLGEYSQRAEVIDTTHTALDAVVSQIVDLVLDGRES